MRPTPRMTANPAKPAARHRAGKPLVAQPESSSEEDEDDEEDEEAEKEAPRTQQQQPRPVAASFPKTSGIPRVGQLGLEARKPVPTRPQIDEGEFETESEGPSGGSEGSSASLSSGEEEEEEDSSEESSSEDEKRIRLRPMFVRKGQRTEAGQTDMNGSGNAVPTAEADKARRLAEADALVQEELERQAAVKAAGKKYWDDEVVDDSISDTDFVDVEAEVAAWRLRELQRLKRDRDAIVRAEREREEVERRRQLSQVEREREDEAFLAEQREGREGRGRMSYMQRYFHRGAFDVEGGEELKRREVMTGRFEDDVGMKEALPEAMKVRDMTRLGKKGRTKYKDMRSEDTGRWGDHLDGKGRSKGGGSWPSDERFRPDFEGDRGREGPTGANSRPLGERKRLGEGEQGDRDKRVRVS